MKIAAFTLAAAVLAHAGCVKTKNAPRGSQSQLSSFEVRRYDPNPGERPWASMEVSLLKVGAPHEKIARTYPKSAFDGAGSVDAALKVPYGAYTIDMTYFDDGKQALYRSCPADLLVEHRIDAPTYKTDVTICAVLQGPPVEPSPGAPSPGATPGPGVTAPSGGGGGVQASGNPFIGKSLYVNPTYGTQVEASAKIEPKLAAQMLKIKSTATAIWIDRIEAIKYVEPALADVRGLQKNSPVRYLVTFIVYNLPERDCAAYASAGELTAAADGMTRYKRDYIDKIAAILKSYQDVVVTLIIEPDSLPNLATNMGVEKCAKAAPLYREGVAYAIKTLSLANTTLYLDSAHGGWLGWPDNRSKMARIFKEVLDDAGGSQKIRGFATNVSNYSPLTMPSPDPNPDSYYEGNPARDELTFAKLLDQDFAQAGIANRHFVIDTARNGQAKSRSVWGNWCNIKGAGIGQRPKAQPAAGIDAYLWLKPPGESDGTSDASAPRFDIKCQSVDSMTGAPQAGQWFHENFKMLVTNAVPPL